MAALRKILSGRATFLPPSTFHRLPSPLLSVSSLFSFFWTSALASCRSIRSRALPHETFQTRQYVMFENPRALRHPRPAVLRGIEDSILPCIFQWTRRANRGGTGRPCKYAVLDDSWCKNWYDYEPISWMPRYYRHVCRIFYDYRIFLLKCWRSHLSIIQKCQMHSQWSLDIL